MNTPILSLDDCEFLQQLEVAGSVTGICEKLKLDKGFVSRKISRISALAPVLERVGGKWRLTSKGSEVVNWYRASSESQRAILHGRTELKIGTTQVISERKLANRLDQIRENTGFKNVSVITAIDDVEKALLGRRMDCAWVCKVPLSPEIRYKKIFTSPLVVCLPSQWKKKPDSIQDLVQNFPYVSHTSINIRELLRMDEAVPHPVAQFDHLSGVRQATVQGLGWSILPLYSVESEIEESRLSMFHTLDRFEEFKLWWVPSRWKRSALDQLLKSLTNI